MIFYRFSYLFCACAAVLALPACGTLVDTPNQKVQVLTPGATGARCTLQNVVVKYVAYPPQTVLVRRAQETLTVTCDAPGNRTKTIVVRSKINGDAMSNALNAGVGAIYDQVSGALYQYPDLIEVDFRNTRATSIGLPAYHAPDTLSPFDPVPEDLENHDISVPAVKSIPVPYKQDPDPDKDSDPEDMDIDFEEDMGIDMEKTSHRGCSQVLCTILFDFQVKESSFWPEGHAKAYSRDKNDDNFA